MLMATGSRDNLPLLLFPLIYMALKHHLTLSNNEQWLLFLLLFAFALILSKIIKIFNKEL